GPAPAVPAPPGFYPVGTCGLRFPSLGVSAAALAPPLHLGCPPPRCSYRGFPFRRSLQQTRGTRFASQGHLRRTEELDPQAALPPARPAPPQGDLQLPVLHRPLDLRCGP